MLFGPTDFARYTNYGAVPSLTYVDPNGTCRIHYAPAALNDNFGFYDNFSLFGKMTDIRNIEFYYHMQPDNVDDRCAYPFTLPSVTDFRESCPIWHFVDAANESPKPTFTIIITCWGKGEPPYDYDAMLNLLLCLMESLTLNGFQNVTVKIVPETRSDGSKFPLPSEMSMKLLRHHLENFMGVAKMTYASDECRMKFCPRHLAETWSKQARRGEATRARSKAGVQRHRRRAKRGLRNLLKI